MSGAALASGLPRVPGQVLRKTPVSQRLAGLNLTQQPPAAAHLAGAPCAARPQLPAPYSGRAVRYTPPKAIGAGSMSTAHQEESRWYPHGMASMTPEMSMQHVLQRRLGAEVEVIPQQTTLYVKPQGVRYEMDGKQRRWEMVVSHPSVAVLLYHTQLKTFILVRQFRPAVYVSAAAEAALAGNPRPPLSVGFTYELCAGIIDKPHLDLKGIAREEILEECGYDVPTHKLHEVTSYISAIGISGARQTIFAAEVDDSMRAPGGGGLADHGEAIEVLSLPASGVAAFLMDQTLAKSGGILFSLMWAQQQLVENDGGLFQRCA